MEDRSPRFRIGQLATRTGVPPERLRKWEARYALLAPQRSNGGFRLYSRDDEQRVRLMERHLGRGFAASEAAVLAKEGVVAPSPARLRAELPPRVVVRSTRLFRRALAEFDEGAANRALDDLFSAFTLEAVLRDAVLPFLREVGDAWAVGRATPGQEHFASTLIEARLMGLTRGWGTGAGPRALLACPEGERHTLGLLTFGIVLSRQGWRITYLGAETPVASLEHAGATTDPDMTLLAGSRAGVFAHRSDDLARLANARPLYLAGAGATKAFATQIGAQILTADPVTAATEIGSPRTNRPA